MVGIKSEVCLNAFGWCLKLRTTLRGEREGCWVISASGDELPCWVRGSESRLLPTSLVETLPASSTALQLTSFSGRRGTSIRKPLGKDTPCGERASPGGQGPSWVSSFCPRPCGSCSQRAGSLCAGGPEPAGLALGVLPDSGSPPSLQGLCRPPRGRLQAPPPSDHAP